MALQQMTFNIGALDDSLAGGKNYIAGQVYEVFNANETLATIFSDVAGTMPITQDGTNNVSNSDGEVEFYIDEGVYYFVTGGKRRDFTVQSTETIGEPNYDFENVADMVAGLTTPYVIGDILSAKSINLAGTESFDYLVYDGATNVPWRNDTAANILATNDRTAYVLTGGLIAVQIPTDDWWAEFNAQKVAMMNAETNYPGLTPSIVFVGDSIVEGYAGTGPETIPNNVRSGVLGAATVATKQIPERIKFWSQEYLGCLSIDEVKNWGYSGDSVVESYDRFDSLGNPDCDIALMMFGTNDNGDGATLPEFIASYTRLIRKYRTLGCGVILLTATKDKGGLSGTTNNFRLAMRQIAEATGCPLIDTTTMANGDLDTMYFDAEHFKAEGYDMLALRILAALINIQCIDDVNGRHLVKSGEVTKSLAPNVISAFPTGTTTIRASSPLHDSSTRFLDPGAVTTIYQYFDQDVTNIRLLGEIGDVTVTVDGGLDYNEPPLKVPERYNKLVSYSGTDARNEFLGQILGKGWHVISILQNSGTSYLSGFNFESVGAFGYRKDTSRTHSIQLGTGVTPESLGSFVISADRLQRMGAFNNEAGVTFTQPQITIYLRTDGPDSNLLGSGTRIYSLSYNNSAVEVAASTPAASRTLLSISTVAWGGNFGDDMTIILDTHAPTFGRITVVVS